jgi:hypothetical protein
MQNKPESLSKAEPLAKGYHEAANGEAVSDDDGDGHQIKLLDFIILLLDKLQRKDLFDLKDRRTLRLVNREFRSCLDAIAPVTALRFADDFEFDPLQLRPFLRESIKTLDLVRYGLNELGKHKGLTAAQARAFISCDFPQLSKLKIAYDDTAAEIIIQNFPNWPALTVVELEQSEGDPSNSFLSLARLPAASASSLKELKFTQPTTFFFSDDVRGVAESNDAPAAIANLTGLTKLDLTYRIVHNSSHRIFLPEGDLSNLKDISLAIEGDYSRFHGALIIPGFKIASSLPNLERFAILRCEPPFSVQVVSEMHNMSFLSQLKVLEIYLPRVEGRPSHISFPHLLPALAGSNLEELNLHNWRPDVTSFKGIELPSLTKLQFECMRSFAGHEDLLFAVLPKLEILELQVWAVDDGQEQTGRPSFLHSKYSTSPFPALKSLRYCGEWTTNVGIQFVQTLLPGLQALDLVPVEKGNLDRLFGRQIRRNGVSQTPLWPHLSSLRIAGEMNRTPRFLELLRLIALHAPALTDLNIKDHHYFSQSEIDELQRDLYNAEMSGSWYGVKLKYRTFFKHVINPIQLWPKTLSDDLHLIELIRSQMQYIDII